MVLPLTGPFAGLHVVDCDTHFTEPHDLWTKRAPAKYRDQVPQVREDPRTGRLSWFLQNDVMLPAGGVSFVNRQEEKVPFPAPAIDITLGLTFEEAHPASHEAHARLEIMDKLGIWANIMYPNTMGFGVAPLINVDPELGRTVVSIYNDACAEFQAESNGRFFPMAVIPFWDIEGSVAEVKRIKALGMKGITMAGNPHLGGLPDLGQPDWNPLWEALVDAELPVGIHISSSNYGTHTEVVSAWPSLEPRAVKPVNSLQMELSNSKFISNIVMSDLLLNYPQLKFVSVESGLGWLPYVLERVDYEYREEFEGLEAPTRPTALEMFRRNLYCTFWFEYAGPTFLLDYIGADTALWSSDFPHPTCVFPSPLERSAEALRDVPPESIRKIMQDNAVKLYKLDLPKEDR
jgi:predicted TIM-barrel fold metal-dependent hydrolase